jgi:N-acetylglucosaminyldiphosphoundecaprenol N-acetyl-beta-D-mannosaminyltransferase
MESNRPRDRIDILGVRVSAISMNDATSTIEQWIRERSRNYVCITGVHGVMESQRDSELLGIHNNAGLVTPDGMPLVWMSRWLGFHHVERVYGPDLMHAMSALSAKAGYRNHYYGGAAGTTEKLQQALTTTYPGLPVVGRTSPPFRSLSSEEDDAIVNEINACSPDIVWVGLSTPKQERWMAAHVHKLNVPVLIGVGAAFDFLSGQKRQAPRWIQRSGLEWLFRCVTEPRRLAGRYLRNNPAFIMKAAKQLAFPDRIPRRPMARN